MKRTLHTIAFTYDDNGQRYTEGAMLTKEEARQVDILLGERQKAGVIFDSCVYEDADPITFEQAMENLRGNSALQWEDYPEVKS